MTFSSVETWQVMTRVVPAASSWAPNSVVSRALDLLHGSFEALTPAQRGHVQGPAFGVNGQLGVDRQAIGAAGVAIGPVKDGRRAARPDQIRCDESDDFVFAAFSGWGGHLSTYRGAAYGSDRAGSVRRRSG